MYLIVSESVVQDESQNLRLKSVMMMLISSILK